MAEWGERQADGSVIVYNDEGRPPRQESWEQNQGIPPASPPPRNNPSPGGGYNPGYGAPMSYVGGSGQLDNVNAAAQLALLIRRLDEVEIPGLNLQQKQLLINSLQNMQNSTGYVNPAIWQGILGSLGGSGGGGAAGTYTTVNGNKTIAQIRQELAAASGGMDWSGKTDQEIVDQYKQTTRGDVTANTASAGSSTGGGPLQQMIGWEQNFRDTMKKAPTPGEWALRLSQITGMTLDQATKMFNQRQGWINTTGGSEGRTDLASWYPSDAEFNTWMGQIAPQKTLDRDRLDELKRQFDAAQGLDRERLAASLSGPKGWIKYQIAQSRMPAGSSPDLMSMFRNTPSFGAMTPDPSNSWENAWANKGKTDDGSDITLPWRDSGKPPIGGTGTQPIEQPRVGIDPRQPTGYGEDRYRTQVEPGGRPIGYQDLLGGAGAGDMRAAVQPTTWQRMQTGYVSTMPVTGQPGEDPRRPVGPPDQYQQPKQPWDGFTQPNQIDPRTWTRMKASQKDMLAGQWAAQGVDPRDAEETMQRSWAGGRANTRTVWR